MVMTSQPDIAGTLPESWAGAGAFPELSELWLLDLPVVGTLPALWGSNGFPALTDLELQLPMVSGTLPAEWGSSGFQALNNLQLQLPMLSGTLPAEWGNGSAFPDLMSLLIDTNTTGILTQVCLHVCFCVPNGSVRHVESSASSAITTKVRGQGNTS